MKTGLWLSMAGGLLFVVSIFGVSSSALSLEKVVGSKAARPNSNALVLLPLLDPLRPTEIEQAYLDSFSILRSENACSQFFGGASAIAALNPLTQQIRPTHLDRRIGIRMTGGTTVVTSALTGFTFRLFAKAEVNLDGPFYTANSFPGRRRVPQIGPFDPNTREARVTTVLHELGHLIRRPDGQWVLPNDGEDGTESEKNTERVVAVCGEQIRALHKFSFKEELLNAQVEASAGSNSWVAR
jgi:hypothetical protein